MPANLFNTKIALRQTKTKGRSSVAGHWGIIRHHRISDWQRGQWRVFL